MSLRRRQKFATFPDSLELTDKLNRALGNTSKWLALNKLQYQTKSMFIGLSYNISMMMYEILNEQKCTNFTKFVS